MQATSNPDTRFPVFPVFVAAILLLGLTQYRGGGRYDTVSTTQFASSYPDSVDTGEMASLPAPQKGVREYHAATNGSQCDKMADRFSREGRRVKLVKKIKFTGSSVFGTVCVFEGEGADPGFYSSDNRSK